MLEIFSSYKDLGKYPSSLGIPSYNFIFEIIYITPSILDCCKETGNPDISFTLLISREKLLSKSNWTNSNHCRCN
jgi:hypothetical protein